MGEFIIAVISRIKGRNASIDIYHDGEGLYLARYHICDYAQKGEAVFQGARPLPPEQSRCLLCYIGQILPNRQQDHLETAEGIEDEKEDKAQASHALEESLVIQCPQGKHREGSIAIKHVDKARATCKDASTPSGNAILDRFYDARPLTNDGRPLLLLIPAKGRDILIIPIQDSRLRRWCCTRQSATPRLQCKLPPLYQTLHIGSITKSHGR